MMNLETIQININLVKDSIEAIEKQLNKYIARQPKPENKPKRTWTEIPSSNQTDSIHLLKNGEFVACISTYNYQPLANLLEAGDRNKQIAEMATEVLFLMQGQLRNGEIDTTEIGDYEYIRKGIDKTLKRINKLKGVDANEPNKP